MTRLATPFVTSGDLIIVSVLVTGPRGTLPGLFVLDTGPAITTMTHDDIDGLLGMNFLSDFNYESRSSERRILVEKTGA